jgi:pyruvyltransferase
MHWSKSANWGDALNPFLVEAISGKPARFEQARFVNKFFCIGSILQSVDEWSTVWGSGLIASNSKLKAPPERILAVRGPLTKNVLAAAGISCPNVFGDPALLLPRFFPCEGQATNAVGVVPHYTEMSHPWIQSCIKEGIKVIDVLSETKCFVREILSCETILSSSLHGLICADSYGVPSRWIELGSEVIGEGFKFRDYYSSIHFDLQTPLKPQKNDNALSLANECHDTPLDLDLDSLLKACPFKR